MFLVHVPVHPFLANTLSFSLSPSTHLIRDTHTPLPHPFRLSHTNTIEDSSCQKWTQPFSFACASTYPTLSARVRPARAQRRAPAPFVIPLLAIALFHRRDQNRGERSASAAVNSLLGLIFVTTCVFSFERRWNISCSILKCST